MVSECLWRHGFAFTDPGALVRHKYDMQYVMFGGTARLPLLLGLESTPKMERAAVVASAVQGVPGGGPCDSQCRWMLRHVVSMHLHARLAKDLKVCAVAGVGGVGFAVGCLQSPRAHVAMRSLQSAPGWSSRCFETVTWAFRRLFIRCLCC